MTICRVCYADKAVSRQSYQLGPGLIVRATSCKGCGFTIAKAVNFLAVARMELEASQIAMEGQGLGEPEGEGGPSKNGDAPQATQTVEVTSKRTRAPRSK